MKNPSDISSTSAPRDNHTRGIAANFFANSRSTRIGSHP